MTLLFATLTVMSMIGVILWASRGQIGEIVGDAQAPDTKAFRLNRAVLLFGAEMNDAACLEQRVELKRILGPLLHGGYRIIEVYGESAPTQNGAAQDWLDNQLMRDTLNARNGFHMIFVDDDGQMLFHSARPVTAEALLHIFDLWEHIDEAAGEALVERSLEQAAPVPSGMMSAANSDPQPVNKPVVARLNQHLAQTLPKGVGNNPFASKIRSRQPTAQVIINKPRPQAPSHIKALVRDHRP